MGEHILVINVVEQTEFVEMAGGCALGTRQFRLQIALQQSRTQTFGTGRF